jgi:hypothetical protein
VSKDFDDIIPRRIDGRTLLPRVTRPLRNVASFEDTVRGIRKELQGTDEGDDFEAALAKRTIVVK